MGETRIIPKIGVLRMSRARWLASGYKGETEFQP